MTAYPSPDRFLDLYPDHLCGSRCSPPCHISCIISRKPITAANLMFLIGEELFAGFSPEAFHEPEWWMECRALAQENERRVGGWWRYHLHWWSVPLEILDEEGP